MNIIIPIGGIGQRFKDEGYEFPKPLINVLGKPMLYRVLESLKVDSSDKIHIVYHNHLKDFNFENLFRFYFPKLNISFSSLDYATKGASETVLLGLNDFTDAELDQNVLILDCDTFYEDDIVSAYKNSTNKNLIFCFNDTDSKPIYSYLKLEGTKVIEIKEKEKISDIANTGAYGFESGHTLKRYCSSILDSNRELYISYVYDKMLNDSITVDALQISNFNCVGTPLQLKAYCNKNKNKADNLRICFDLDNTLVTHPTIPGDYETVLPIQKNIDYLKLLKRLGHTIIIYTARRMRTHSGNIGSVLADVGSVTFTTLEKYEIPYDEIYFGKPYANFYIDDLAFNSNSSLDKSLGIYDTDISPRSFNKVEYTDTTVTKHTSNPGEIYWYKHIPENVKHYFPKLLGYTDSSVTLDYIEGVSYSYMYTNKTLNFADLNVLLQCIKEIHSNISTDTIDIKENYSNKLSSRYFSNLELYSKYENHLEIYNVLSRGLHEYENKNVNTFSVIHGDPVFTNIIKTKNGIKFIDMRGRHGNTLTLGGDINYDYAKIYQSLIGYDFILNAVEIDTIYVDSMVKKFESFFDAETISDIKLITASLLFTILPLHEEHTDKFKKYFKLINSLL